MKSRKFLKGLLVNILKDRTIAGSSVFATRAIPTSIENLPVILIYLKNESVEIFDESPRRYRRNATFTIECLAAGNSEEDADNIAEDIAREVEDLLAEDETLGTLGTEECINDSFLNDVTFTSESEGQSPVAAAIISFTVDYFINPNPITDAPDFLRSGVEWQVGHHNESPDDVIDARDDFTIPQE